MARFQLDSVKRALIVREARDWIGVPYRLHGHDRHGIDCSNLVHEIYLAAVGLAMRGDCNTLFLKCAVIPVVSCQPGDLIFFRPAPGRKRSLELATHVAIATEEGRCIHASWRVGVVYEEPISDVLGSHRIMLIERKDYPEIRAWIDRQWVETTGSLPP